MRQLRPPSLLEQLGLSGAAARQRPLRCATATRSRHVSSSVAAELFDLQPTGTLHDRTSTCFEGPAAAGPPPPFQGEAPQLSAARQLGLVLDASGFVRRSRVLAGNAAESGTLRAQAIPRVETALQHAARGSVAPGHDRAAWRRSGSTCVTGGETATWTTLFSARLASQRTGDCGLPIQADGRMQARAHRATQAESWQRAIHERLDVDASPGGVRKLFVQPRRRRENARNAVPHA